MRDPAYGISGGNLIDGVRDSFTYVARWERFCQFAVDGLNYQAVNYDSRFGIRHALNSRRGQHCMIHVTGGGLESLDHLRMNESSISLVVYDCQTLNSR